MVDVAVMALDTEVFAMLVAAASRNGGCEVTAVSNWLRGRDDQLGCPVFAPLDALDAAWDARGAGREKGRSHAAPAR